ncbi:MAG TPA: DUF1987 domain-containing protein [Cyclobacteriaceae bacterium]|jgi:hypothetical protein|nr:DUF1987 domain-containing protein [Cyclobacteriaceae bacterium]
MEPLRISKTDDTPDILLDKSTGKFEISGRSLPEDSVEFYTPIFQWLEMYAKDPNPVTEFVFKLDYLNTASSKMIQDVLSALEKIKGVKVVWYFYEDDEDMEEMGQELSELVEIPFEYKPT